MPGPIAAVVALIAPLVLSLAGTTLPPDAEVCVAVSLAPLSLARLWLRPHPPPMIVAAASAAVESRIRICLSRAEVDNAHVGLSRVCAGPFHPRGRPIRL